MNYSLKSGLSKRQTYELMLSDLQRERSSFLDLWRQTGDYFLPTRPRFFTSDRNKGNRRNQLILNSTGPFAARTLGSGMHAGVTSPARPYFELSTPDPDLAEFGPVSSWLYDVTQRMLAVDAQTNWYQELPTVYEDLGVFGTAPIDLREDVEDVYRCYSYPVGSYAMATNSRGVVDTFAREYQLTVYQLVTQFGWDEDAKSIDWSKFSTAVKKLWDKAQYQSLVEVCSIVAPNVDRDDDRYEAQYKPFMSAWIEKGGEPDKFLLETGYNEFPVMVPRWAKTGEDIYGTNCPGFMVLGDNKGLQILTKKKAITIELGNNPTVQAPSHMKQKGVTLVAGEVNYVDLREQQQGIRSVREVDPRFVQFMLEDVQAHEWRINHGFFVDLFQMLVSRGPDDPEMTATEIRARYEEKLIGLGPVLQNVDEDLLKRSIDRKYAIMDRRGMIPPAPPELHNVRLAVKFRSILHQAQQSVNLVGLDRFVGSTIANPAFAEVPEVRAKIDVLQIVSDYARMTGITPRIVRTDDEANAIVDEQRRIAAQAQEAALAEQRANAAHKLGQTPLDTNSALDAAREAVAQ